MRKNVSNGCSIQYLLLTVFLLSIGSIQAVSAQERKLSHPAPGPQSAGAFEPKSISLALKGCKGDIRIPSRNFTGTVLETEDGKTVTITPEQGEALKGEVMAYSRSAHWRDANIAFVFDRPTVPSTDPAWKPPVIVSLVLKQDRRRPKEITLEAAPGLNPDFPTTKLSCASPPTLVN